MLRIGLSVLIPPSLRDWIAEDHLVWGYNRSGLCPSVPLGE
jgi:hypothetical protein